MEAIFVVKTYMYNHKYVIIVGLGLFDGGEDAEHIGFGFVKISIIILSLRLAGIFFGRHNLTEFI